MGNVGDIMNACYVTDTVGLGGTSRAIINWHAIEPWPARALVKTNLQRQAYIAKRHPFRLIHVSRGMAWYREDVNGFFERLSRDKFVDKGTDLMLNQKVQHTMQDRTTLYDMFDAMDFDGNGELSVGEWAGGLSVFFRGTLEECIHAVFDCLDTNGDRQLSKAELTEYFKPLVNAMVPPEAAALRPVLLKTATDRIYNEMDFDHSDSITSDEMIGWTHQGNNVVARLATIIEDEVVRQKDMEERRAHAIGQPAIPPRNQPRERGGPPYSARQDGRYGGEQNGTRPVDPNREYRGPQSDYRHLPAPPPPPQANAPFPQYGSSADSFMTDTHQESVYGGGQNFSQYGGGQNFSQHGGGQNFSQHGGGQNFSQHGRGQNLPQHGGGPNLPQYGGGQNLPQYGGGKKLSHTSALGQMAQARNKDELRAAVKQWDAASQQKAARGKAVYKESKGAGSDISTSVMRALRKI